MKTAHGGIGRAGGVDEGLARRWLCPLRARAPSSRTSGSQEPAGSVPVAPGLAQDPAHGWCPRNVGRAGDRTKGGQKGVLWQGAFLVAARGDRLQAVGRALLHLGLLFLTQEVRRLDQLSLEALPTAACWGSGTPVSQPSVRIPVLQAQQHRHRASAHSAACKLCSQPSPLPLPRPRHKLQVPHLSSEGKTSTSGSDARMHARGGRSRFLPGDFV